MYRSGSRSSTQDVVNTTGTVTRAVSEPSIRPRPPTSRAAYGGGMGALEPHRGDFYAYETLLPEDEQKEILRLREFLEHEVRPIADEYWAEAEFPRHLIAPLRDLDLVGGAYEGFRDPPFSRLFSGFTSLEMSRVDPSFGTFFGVHAGLAFASIFHCGSPEQRDRWLPGMADLTSIGAFALTEPDDGSDIAGGLAHDRPARRRPLGAQREEALDRQRDLRRPGRGLGPRRRERARSSGSSWRRGRPGFTATKIEGKIALRSVQNADIVLEDVAAPGRPAAGERRLLQGHRQRPADHPRRCGAGAPSDCRWAPTRRRSSTPWNESSSASRSPASSSSRTTGHHAGEHHRLARRRGPARADAGRGRSSSDEHAALAKAYVASRMRETVGMAREVHGRQRDPARPRVVRFFADAEAVYSYEGTREMNQLIVGRAITGTGAFV